MGEGLRGTIGAEYRRQLLRMNRERIETTYETARARGLEEAVVLVLDLQDDRAAHLAQSLGLPWAQIEQSREECSRGGVVPVLLFATCREAVTCLVQSSALNNPQARKSPIPLRRRRFAWWSWPTAAMPLATSPCRPNPISVRTE